MAKLRPLSTSHRGGGADRTAATVPTPPFYCVPDEGLEAGSLTGMHIPGACAGDGLALQAQKDVDGRNKSGHDDRN